MDIDYQKLEFVYRACPDQTATMPAHHPLVVVGAGPVGLSLAIDLAQRGEQVLLLDNDHRLSTGSRAICFSKRTLEIWDRLGVGQRMVDKGVSWRVGRVFFGDAEVYHLDRLPPGRAFLGTSNLQLDLLTERFQTRFQAIKLLPPTTEELAAFLSAHWAVPSVTATQIAVGSGGCVRAALADLESYLDHQPS